MYLPANRIKDHCRQLNSITPISTLPPLISSAHKIMVHCSNKQKSASTSHSNKTINHLHYRHPASSDSSCSTRSSSPLAAQATILDAAAAPRIRMVSINCRPRSLHRPSRTAGESRPPKSSATTEAAVIRAASLDAPSSRNSRGSSRRPMMMIIPSSGAMHLLNLRRQVPAAAPIMPKRAEGSFNFLLLATQQQQFHHR